MLSPARQPIELSRFTQARGTRYRLQDRPGRTSRIPRVIARTLRPLTFFRRPREEKSQARKAPRADHDDPSPRETHSRRPREANSETRATPRATTDQAAPASRWHREATPTLLRSRATRRDATPRACAPLSRRCALRFFFFSFLFSFFPAVLFRYYFSFCLVVTKDQTFLFDRS